MKLKFFKTALLLLIIAGAVSAQNRELNYNVKSFTIRDEIKKSDPLDEQLGRVNNFEIYLNKNDQFSIQFHTDKFLPLILLISPSGNKEAFNSRDGKNINFSRKINETGNWELYIIGGKDAAGSYECKVNFADSAAVNPPKVLSDCGFIKFVVEHSEADFVFIKDLISDNFSSVSAKDFKVGKFFFDAEKRLHLELSGNNSKNLFDKIKKSIYDCFEDWKVKEGKRREVNGNYETVLSIIERDKKEPRFVKIVLKENSVGEKNDVELIFGKIKS